VVAAFGGHLRAWRDRLARVRQAPPTVTTRAQAQQQQLAAAVAQAAV